MACRNWTIFIEVFTKECEIILYISSVDTGHVYHRDCIASWLKSTRTCPQCRNITQNRMKESKQRLYLSFGNHDDARWTINEMIKTIDTLENDWKQQRKMSHVAIVALEEENDALNWRIWSRPLLGTQDQNVKLIEGTMNMEYAIWHCDCESLSRRWTGNVILNNWVKKDLFRIADVFWITAAILNDNNLATAGGVCMGWIVLIRRRRTMYVIFGTYKYYVVRWPAPAHNLYLGIWFFCFLFARDMTFAYSQPHSFFVVSSNRQHRWHADRTKKSTISYLLMLSFSIGCCCCCCGSLRFFLLSSAQSKTHK